MPNPLFSFRGGIIPTPDQAVTSGSHAFQLAQVGSHASLG